MPIGDQFEPAQAQRTTRSRRPARAGAAVIAIVAVLSLVATACGGGRSDSGDGGTTDTTKAAASGGFGDMASPCGPAEGTNAAGTDPGVTADSITIAYGDDAGFTGRPGLNKEMSDAVKAMIDWCNEQGGINGRTVKGNYYDAAILNVNNAMTEACQGNNFFLVGQGWSLDSVAGGRPASVASLPAVPTYTVSPQFAHGKLMYQPTPNPVDEMSIPAAFQMAEAFPDRGQEGRGHVRQLRRHHRLHREVAAVVGAGRLGPTSTARRSTTSRVSRTGSRSSSSSRTAAPRSCTSRARPYPNFENVLDAAKQIGYNPKWMTEANFYDAEARRRGTPPATPTTSTCAWRTSRSRRPARCRPCSSTSTSSLTAAARTSLLGMQATAAFLLWAEAVAGSAAPTSAVSASSTTCRR